MEKYITSIKDLVIQALTNGSEIKAKAESGDAMSCFQMGMIHLLGVDSKIDFAKSRKYLSKKSLSDNKDAIRLLGFIAEIEGDYSYAFQKYAKSESNEKCSYIEKVDKGRKHIQDYLIELDLPATLNNEISLILKDYSKGGTLKTDAGIKLASICNDKESYIELAQVLYDSHDYISAINWLQKGGIELNHPLYSAISEKYKKSRKEILSSKDIQFVNLYSQSLLPVSDSEVTLVEVKKRCDQTKVEEQKLWKDKAKSIVNQIEAKHRVLEQEMREEEDNRKEEKKQKIIYSGIVFVTMVVGYVEKGNSYNFETFLISVAVAAALCFGYYSNEKDKKEKKDNRKKK